MKKNIIGQCFARLDLFYLQHNSGTFQALSNFYLQYGPEFRKLSISLFHLDHLDSNVVFFAPQVLQAVSRKKLAVSKLALRLITNGQMAVGLPRNPRSSWPNTKWKKCGEGIFFCVQWVVSPFCQFLNRFTCFFFKKMVARLQCVR